MVIDSAIRSFSKSFVVSDYANKRVPGIKGPLLRIVSLDLQQQ